MDPNETMVENMPGDEAADDALPEGVAEETDESEESLESLTGDDGQADEQPQQKEASEPGWIKQRISKAVDRALAEQERRLTAQFEQQMAPIREKMLNDEAKELVRQGEFKSLERAKEYLQLKQGVSPKAAEPQQQPRNEQGQFTPKDDAGTTARISMLAHQADTLKAKGYDVMAVFKSDPDIKESIISGKMDFYDVADRMEKPGKKPPAPMRSPNGASGQNPNAIDSMSDEQFRRLEKRIAEGARIKLS